MSGYAVRKDGQGYHAVDGPEPDADDALKTFPDPETETYSKTLPPNPVPLPAEVLTTANAKRDELLSVAGLRIAPLQDAIDLDEATAADLVNIKLWKQYRVDINRVSGQEGFPSEIDWPVQPS